MLTVGTLLPYTSADVTVLCISRDQHTTNEDNPKAQSVFSTVACIIDDLSLLLEPIGISHRAHTVTYAKDVLSNVLIAPIHPCKVKPTNEVEGQTDGEGQQVKDILSSFQSPQTIVDCTHTSSTVLQGKREIRVMCETSFSPASKSGLCAPALVNIKTPFRYAEPMQL